MSVECCECGCVMGFKEGVGVSHGICAQCMKRNHHGAYLAGLRREIQERLAQFDRWPGASDMNVYYFRRGQ